MARRPIFVPGSPTCTELVRAYNIEFQWYPGLAVSQKQKSIASLHRSAVSGGLVRRPLEISSKSRDALGRTLSAFHLAFTDSEWPRGCVEQVFQSSKVFRLGGPFPDILAMEPKDAKRDVRLKESGDLVAFEFQGQRWPLVPRTMFYDWLYLNALAQNPAVGQELADYDGFTDIEFNPEKSINCQANSAALYVSLVRRGLLQHALSAPECFRSIASSAASQGSIKLVQGLRL